MKIFEENFPLNSAQKKKKKMKYKELMNFCDNNNLCR